MPRKAKVLDWTLHALTKRAESANRRGDRFTAELYNNVAYLYDLGLIKVGWEAGLPVLNYADIDTDTVVDKI